MRLSPRGSLLQGLVIILREWEGKGKFPPEWVHYVKQLPPWEGRAPSCNGWSALQPPGMGSRLIHTESCCFASALCSWTPGACRQHAGPLSRNWEMQEAPSCSCALNSYQNPPLGESQLSVEPWKDGLQTSSPGMKEQREERVLSKETVGRQYLTQTPHVRKRLRLFSTEAHLFAGLWYFFHSY